MYSIETVICLLCIYGVISESRNQDGNVSSDTSSVISVRMPSLNAISRGERMTIAVPVFRFNPTSFGRPMPVTDSTILNSIGASNNNNNPQQYYYELHKNYPQLLQQQVCIPQIGYTSPETTCPVNSYRTNYNNINSYTTAIPNNINPENTQIQYENNPKIMNIHIPPGLPSKATMKLDKLINSINRSLQHVCQKNTDDSTQTNKNNEDNGIMSDDCIINELENEKNQKRVEKNKFQNLVQRNVEGLVEEEIEEESFGKQMKKRNDDLNNSFNQFPQENKIEESFMT